MSFKYLVISDIHLGHRRTKSEFIIRNLNNYLSLDMLKSIDCLFIAGDFFDRLLSLNSGETYDIMVYIRQLLERCSSCNTMLRVLKGTQSHDFDQCNLFINIYDCIKDKMVLDFRYVDMLSIETLPNGHTVMYLPDEWKPTADMIYRDVKALLKTKKMNKVDIIIMHGMFSFQLPAHLKSPLIHNEFNYLNICKHFIHPGHIHTPAVFDRIYAQGSFDRLAHNEEHPKGGYLCEIGDTYVEPKFIENKNAKKYITLNVNKKPIEAVIARISKLGLKLPKDSYIRLKASIDSDAITYLKRLQTTFLDLNISVKALEKGHTKEDEVETTTAYKPIVITKDNIFELLQNLYSKREDIDKDKIPKIDEFLKKLLEENG